MFLCVYMHLFAFLKLILETYSIGNSRRKRGGVLIRILKCKLPTAWPVCESLKIFFAIISIKFKLCYTNLMASYCDTKGWYEESSPLDTKALS